MSWSDRLYKSDISFSGTGDNTIISAPGAGKRIAIDHVNFLLGNTASDIQLKDGSTNYGGAYPMGARGSMALDNVMKNYDGLITLSANAAFVINSGTAVQVSGFVRYRILDNN